MVVAVGYCPSPHKKLGRSLIVLGILLAFVIYAVGFSIFVSLFFGSMAVIIGFYLQRGKGGLPIQRLPAPGMPIVRCDHCGRDFEEKLDRCPNCGGRTNLI